MKQYYHKIEYKGGQTICIETDLTCEDLYNSIIQNKKLIIKVGIANCSKEDNYCRKTGRELSSSRLKETEFISNNLSTHHSEGKHLIQLLSTKLEKDNKIHRYDLYFRLKPGALTPYFIEGNHLIY